MELPLICKRKLGQDGMFALAQKAGKFVTEWQKASGNNDALFNNLPSLDDKQFAAFYKGVFTGEPEQPDAVKPGDAEGKSKEMLTVVNFSDSNLAKVSWLQFWVYMCNAGIKPEENEYKQSAAGEAKFDKYMKAKLLKDVTSAAAKNRPQFGLQGKKRRRRRFAKN